MHHVLYTSAFVWIYIYSDRLGKYPRISRSINRMKTVHETRVQATRMLRILGSAYHRKRRDESLHAAACHIREVKLTDRSREAKSSFS